MVQWEPDRTTTIAWNVLGIALALLGIVLFGAAYATVHEEVVSVELIGVGSLLAPLLIFALLIVVHELIHGLAMRAFGARPVYGAGVLYRIMPYAYCTAPGHRFSRAGFVAVALAPFVALTAAGLLWVLYGPLGEALVLPLGLHLGGCIGDFWAVGLCLRQPPGTLYEDVKTGIRFHRPEAART